jgi:coxsackievirus/adenovirus receptor
VNQQRQKLHDLQTLIDNLGSMSETVSDKAFEDRLKEAEKSIMDLLDEAQTSKGAAGLDPFRDFMMLTCNVSLA